ncbi:phosphoribosylpyrophosphate synthetase [Pedobacter duraquae]|uniref:Phosphoribosylpyrophosphate synthetase n=1 Tax=Pedobacter duraquae TaxID=425511 RepID=A0A4R6ILE7_9SPHI|nr:phosphoribosylpyrophosphate synthetase [Pedobacter duraquae]TDO22954.1 hypothetical protein CLV32_1939 [Pedobacter duraquae]
MFKNTDSRYNMEEMKTLTQVMQVLDQRGYTIDFNLEDVSSDSPQHLLKSDPERFVIDHVYRFEGDTDPDDEAILYAVSSVDKSLMGIFVNGYGISAETVDSVVIDRLKKREEL